MFSVAFDIGIKSGTTNTQIEIIELKNNLNLKASIVSNQNKILKSAQKLICLFESTYLREQFFFKPNYSKFKSQSRISDAHLHDILCIAASIMEPNIATIMHQKNEFYQSHCKCCRTKRKNSKT